VNTSKEVGIKKYSKSLKTQIYLEDIMKKRNADLQEKSTLKIDL
jgi:hypothetical protein